MFLNLVKIIFYKNNKFLFKSKIKYTYLTNRSTSIPSTILSIQKNIEYYIQPKETIMKSIPNDTQISTFKGHNNFIHQ
jgi:hypothetical protein